MEQFWPAIRDLGAIGGGLLIFAVLVVLVLSRLVAQANSRAGETSGFTNGTREVALKAMTTLADVTERFTVSTDNQARVLQQLAEAVGDARRECTEKHLVTHGLLTELVNNVRMQGTKG